jgi:hypothetical protein
MVEEAIPPEAIGLEKLPESMRAAGGHGGSHTFIAHEFVSAIAEETIAHTG